ncbi:hypothetical protein BRIZO_4 [Vibrio phage Brizo]|uniref:Uncharacterized protein n=1 Tax=Vibrio phage Brizo TaxID=2590896 RepID=A0A4Y6EIH8_9CAUD|nr:hypothetical protein KNU58_gp005 [Vibrio phage Brizo]QDF14423.1 hypothetical protein BRIZO_4 [Vibrio phage Brizo]
MKSTQIKLANVLASYYGMKTQNPTKAKKHLVQFMKKHELTILDVQNAMPFARVIIQKRTDAFMNGSTTARLND